MKKHGQMRVVTDMEQKVIPKTVKMLNDLRKGEQVHCPKCREGIMQASKGTDYRTTSCFVCSKCGLMFNIN